MLNVNWEKRTKEESNKKNKKEHESKEVLLFLGFVFCCFLGTHFSFRSVLFDSLPIIRSPGKHISRKPRQYSEIRHLINKMKT